MDSDDLSGVAEGACRMAAKSRRVAVVNDADQNVKPVPGPDQFKVVKAAELIALGLPSACVSGRIIEDIELEEDQRWLVFELLGTLYGVAYATAEEPFGDGDVQLTILVEEKAGRRSRIIMRSQLAA